MSWLRYQVATKHTLGEAKLIIQTINFWRKKNVLTILREKLGIYFSQENLWHRHESDNNDTVGVLLKGTWAQLVLA